MEKLTPPPMRSYSGKNSFDACIEDRQVYGFRLDPINEQGKINWGISNQSELEPPTEFIQIPGASLFYSFTKDVLAEVRRPNSVKHSLADTVSKDASRLRSEYQLDIQVSTQTDANRYRYLYVAHNDTDHGDEEDGCGFAKVVELASVYLEENIDSVLKEAKIKDESLRRTAHNMADATARLARNGNYFEVTGGKLVKRAIESGAALLTYLGDHTASSLNINENQDVKYDSAGANSRQATSTPSFNVDSNVNLARRAQEHYGLDGDDAILFSKILAIATVRVLGADGPISHT